MKLKARGESRKGHVVDIVSGPQGVVLKRQPHNLVDVLDRGNCRPRKMKHDVLHLSSLKRLMEKIRSHMREGNRFMVWRSAGLTITSSFSE